MAASRERSRSPARGAAQKRILVTGAAGLLGQAVIERLLAKGHKVLGCDQAPQPAGQGCEYVQCNLADAQALQSACKSCEAVVHLGGISGPGFVFDPPVPASVVASTNITGTMNVLEAARLAGVGRVVFASSVVVYWPVDREKGWATDCLPESAPVDSTETYGASKIASEQLCRAYASMGFLDSVSLRVGWVYGPKRTTACVVRALLLGAPSNTPGRHCRDWIYVDDAAEAMALAALREKPFKGVALNVSGGHLPHRVIEGSVERALGKLERGAVAPAPDPLLPPMDLSAAKRELGWEPKEPISAGVRRVAASLGLAQGEADAGLAGWKGLFVWDAEKCVNVHNYYKFWGTLTDAEAEQCATSPKEFHHVEATEGALCIRFKAADTTRGAESSYSLRIDGRPHEIDPVLRARANNSIKMNPTGKWAHWWEGAKLVMEQPCVVRGEELTHRLTREVLGDSLLCHELVFRRGDPGQELLRATMGFRRD